MNRRNTTRPKRDYNTAPQPMQMNMVSGSSTLQKLTSAPNAYDMSGDYLAKNRRAAQVRATLARTQNMRPSLTGHNTSHLSSADQKLFQKQPDFFYDPNYINSNHTFNLLHTDAKKKFNDASHQNTTILREQSKHRSVGSWSLIYANSFGEASLNPVPAYILTGCGINLMGSSSKDNERFLAKPIPKDQGKARFVSQQAKTEFKETYKKLYLRWLWQMNQAGVQVAMVPMVGGDLYTKMLNPLEQAEAQQMIHDAFREAAEEFDTQVPKNGGKRHLQEIIYVLPDSGGKRSQAYNKANEVFQGYPKGKTDSPLVTITNGDMLDLSIRIKNSAPNLKVGILNAGSDRTIGGHYKTWESANKEGAPPVEETLATNTDFVYRQAMDYRTSPKEYQTNHYPDSLLLAKTKQRRIISDREEDDDELNPVADTAHIQARQQPQANSTEVAREQAQTNEHFTTWASNKNLERITRDEMGQRLEVVTLEVHKETVRGRPVEKSRCELTKNGPHELSLTGVREENRDEMAEKLVEAFLATYFGEEELPTPLPDNITMTVTTESDELYEAIREAAEQKGLMAQRQAMGQNVAQYREERNQRIDQARGDNGTGQKEPGEAQDPEEETKDRYGI